MPAIAFALPVKAGQEEAGMKFIQSLTGEKSGEAHARKSAHGFRRIKVWRQTRPEHMVVVYLEADDIDAALTARHTSSDPHDKWYAEQIEAITGHHPGRTAKPGDHPSTLLFDWHADRGHSSTHHD